LQFLRNYFGDGSFLFCCGYGFESRGFDGWRVDKKKGGLWELKIAPSRWSSLVIWAERRFPSGMTNKRGEATIE
jgi:hypothetical protein